jgi:hypothetical protein
LGKWGVVVVVVFWVGVVVLEDWTYSRGKAGGVLGLLLVSASIYHVAGCCCCFFLFFSFSFELLEQTPVDAKRKTIAENNEELESDNHVRLDDGPGAARNNRSWTIRDTSTGL